MSDESNKIDSASQIGKHRITDVFAYHGQRAIHHLTNFDYWGPLIFCVAIIVVCLYAKWDWQWFSLLVLLALITFQAQRNGGYKVKHRREMEDEQDKFISRLRALEPNLPYSDKPRIESPRDPHD